MPVHFMKPTFWLILSVVWFAIGFTDTENVAAYLGRPLGAIFFGAWLISSCFRDEVKKYRGRTARKTGDFATGISEARSGGGTRQTGTGGNSGTRAGTAYHITILTPYQFELRRASPEGDCLLFLSNRERPPLEVE